MKNHSTSNKSILWGMIWKFGERVLAQGISFIVSVILARIMLPQQYGLVAMVLIFISIADILVTSGFSTALIQKKDASRLDFSTIFWCSLIMSILVYVLMFFGANSIAEFYGVPELVLLIRVFSLKVLISAFNSIQHAYVSRHMMFKKFFYSTLFGTLLSGIIGIIMAVTGFGVWALVAQYLVNSLVDTIILGITVPWRPRLEFSTATAKKLIQYGWKILAADLIGTIYNNLRQLLIGKFYTSADLAYYNKGKQIPEFAITNIDSTISTVFFPVMSNLSGDAVRVKEMTRKLITLTAYIIFPMLFGLAAVAKPLIVILLTEKWMDAVIFLQITCIARIFMTISNANLQAMKAMGRSDVILKLEVIKKPIGILLIIIALQINVTAIALTMPIYSLYAVIVNMNPNRSILGYTISEQLKDFAPPMFLSLGMMTIILMLNHFIFYPAGFGHGIVLMLNLICGISFYLILSYIFKLKAFHYLLSFFKNAVNNKRAS